MHFSSILALVSLPFIADALENGLPILISKHSALHGADGRVDITKVQASRHHAIEFVSFVLFEEKVGTHCYWCPRKIERGFDTFEGNTGRPHSLASKLKHSDNVRRAAGNETLHHQPVRWYGPITVGTPRQTFTGSSIISCSAAVELIP